MNGKEGKLIKEMLQGEINMVREDNQRDHLRIEKTLDDICLKVDNLMQFKIKVMTWAACISVILSTITSVIIYFAEKTK